MTRCKVMFFFGIIQVGGMLLYHLADFHCSKWREFIVANGGFLLYDLADFAYGLPCLRIPIMRYTACSMNAPFFGD